jgi:hypothetical protein
MCELHAPPHGPPVRATLTRLAKLQWSALLLLAAAAAVVIALHGGHGGTGGRMALGPADRVFFSDVARQAGDAEMLVRQARARPELEALARSIRSVDVAVLAARGLKPARTATTVRAHGAPAVRRALARHEDDDGVIARVALGSAVGPMTKRMAAQLLASSRRPGDRTR